MRLLTCLALEPHLCLSPLLPWAPVSYCFAPPRTMNYLRDNFQELSIRLSNFSIILKHYPCLSTPVLGQSLVFSPCLLFYVRGQESRCFASSTSISIASSKCYAFPHSLLSLPVYPHLSTFYFKVIRIYNLFCGIEFWYPSHPSVLLHIRESVSI